MTFAHTWPSSLVISGRSARRDVLVAWRHHLVLRWKVDPNLETVHQAPVFHHVVLREFGVNDAATGGHPLHIAGVQITPVASRIGVLHTTGQKIRDGFETAVGVVGCTDGFARCVIDRSHFVKKQERAHQTAHGSGASDFEAASLENGVRGYDGFQGTVHVGHSLVMALSMALMVSGLAALFLLVTSERPSTMQPRKENCIRMAMMTC